jgi:hypothetical protein
MPANIGMQPLKPGDIIAIIALTISLATFALSYRSAFVTAIRSRKPVLIFEYDGEQGWYLRNIGGGPALNAIVAQIRRVNPNSPEGHWFNPVRIPPIAKDGSFLLKWLGHVNNTGLGATYSDSENFAYTSTCGNDLSRTYKGTRFGGWREDEIGRHWSQPSYKDSETK